MREGVECDTCQVRRLCPDGYSVEKLREQLRVVGWLCRETAEGVEVDVCPLCRAK